jgi:ribulose kinase
MRQAFIGIDVGTSSARAGVFDEKGSLLATARHPITVWHEAGGVVEQSSSEIWAACVASVRTAMVEAAVPPSAVRGLGFDATCSLVVLDAGANPLTVSASGDERRNVIVWMDHRAIAEARQVNDTRDDVLRRRLDLARNGNPQASMVEAAPAIDLSIGGSFLRSRRPSFVSRHRIDGAFNMHARLQMEFSVP